MKKDIVIDGLKKETFSMDEMEKKIVLNEEINIDPHLQHNKTLLNLNDGYNKSRDLKRVASIPTLALDVWAKEYNGNGNWFALPKEIQSKILKTKLNSNEFKYFRTAEGKI